VALSGGQAARAVAGQRAALALRRLLLDEPTNDLDFAGLERLEQFVLGLQAGLVVVSHDREFLARTVSSVLDSTSRRAPPPSTAAASRPYVQERALRRQQARDAYEEYEDKRTGLVQQAQRQREQSVRGALRAKRKMPDNDRRARARASRRPRTPPAG
jgi:ATPase subunit of ABC transporter with duplicated ATPase domains